MKTKTFMKKFKRAVKALGVAAIAATWLGGVDARPAHAGHWEFLHIKAQGKNERNSNDPQPVQPNGVFDWLATITACEDEGDQTACPGIHAGIKGTPAHGDTPASDTASASTSGSMTAYFKWSRDDDGDGLDDIGDVSKPTRHFIIRESWMVQGGGPEGATVTATTPLGGQNSSDALWAPAGTLPGKGDEIAQTTVSGFRYTIITVTEAQRNQEDEPIIVQGPTRTFNATASIAGYHENWNAAEGIIYLNDRADVGAVPVYGVQVWNYNFALSTTPDGNCAIGQPGSTGSYPGRVNWDASVLVPDDKNFYAVVTGKITLPASITPSYTVVVNAERVKDNNGTLVPAGEDDEVVLFRIDDPNDTEGGAPVIDGERKTWTYRSHSTPDQQAGRIAGA